MPNWDSEFEQRKRAAEAARQRRLTELRSRDQREKIAPMAQRSAAPSRPAPSRPQEMSEVELPPWLKKLLDPTGTELPRRSVAPAPPPPTPVVEKAIQRQIKKAQKAAPVKKTPPPPQAFLSKLENNLAQPAAQPSAAMPVMALGDLRPLLHNQHSLRQAVILSEILSPPVSLR